MKNKTRKDCFWGLHFDFHADVDSVGIGIQNTAEDVGRYLDAAKPDYIHYDTKGHPGYTSYCTKYGNAAPGIEADFLKVVREETKKRGILLFAHYSGILEELASKRHPEWTVLDEEGKTTTRMDVTGPYVEELMIPQLIELAVEYGLDGAWIDGDCWAWQENWNPEYLEGFYEKSGYRSIDPDLNSPSHLAFREYCRNTFTDYLKHYMTEIKKAAPGFEITSNCAYGHFIPQKPLDEIDYLTEDAAPYAGGEGYLARCFARSGKPWDIGDWGGTCLTEKRYAAVYRNRKCVDWICREASRAISLGGGFTSRRDGGCSGGVVRRFGRGFAKKRAYAHSLV